MVSIKIKKMKNLLTLLSLLYCVSIYSQPPVTIKLVEDKDRSDEYRDKNCDKCKYSAKPNNDNISGVNRDGILEFKIVSLPSILSTITKDVNVKLIRKDFTESDLLTFKTKKFIGPEKYTEPAPSQPTPPNPPPGNGSTQPYKAPEKTITIPGYFLVNFEINSKAKDKFTDDYYLMVETSRSSDKKKDIRLYPLSGKDLQQLKSNPTLEVGPGKEDKKDKKRKTETYVARPEGSATSQLSQLTSAPSEFPIPGKSITVSSKPAPVVNNPTPVVNTPTPVINKSNFDVYINNTPAGSQVENTTFATAKNWLGSNGKNTYKYYVGDFNGDRLSDICIQKPSATGDGLLTYEVAISTGTGFANPTQWGSFYKSDKGNFFVKIGDVNGDKKDDIILFTFNDGNRRVGSLTSTGTKFNEARIGSNKPSSVNADYKYLVGNFDLNNGIDVAFLDEGSSSIELLRGTNDGYFNQQSRLVSIGALPANGKTGSVKDILDILPGDVNGDGYDDIVAFTNKVNSASKVEGCVFVFKANWVPSASQSQPSRLDYSSVTLWNGSFCYVNEIPVIGDFNGDKKDDIATCVKLRGDICFAYSTGNNFNGVGQCKINGIGTNPDYLSRLALGYFNNDSKADVINFSDLIKDLKPGQTNVVKPQAFYKPIIMPKIKISTAIGSNSAANANNNTTVAAKGPNYGSEPIPLIDIINVEDKIATSYKANNENGSLSMGDICGINIELTPDSAKESGALYYKPNSYNIKYSQKTNRYDFNARLEKTVDGDLTKDTKFQLKLRPSFDENDDSVLVALVRAYMTNNPDVIKGNKISILPYPHDVSHPVEYSQTNTNVTINSPSASVIEDIKDDVSLTFATTDDRDKDLFLTIALDDNTMSGNTFGEIKYTQKNNQLSAIPVNLNFLSKQTLGLIKVEPNWISNSNITFKNQFPIPITPKFVHCLFIIKDVSGKLVPAIYSWGFNAKDSYIKPGESAVLNLQSLPAWLKQAPEMKKVWIDYDIATTPADMYQTYKDNLRDTLLLETVTKNEIKCRVTLKSDKGFANGKISQIRVIVKSKYFDSKNKTAIESPITGYLTPDQKSLECSNPLYISNKDNTSADINVKYKLQVLITDTEETKESDWIDGKILQGANEISIGKDDIKNAFPDIQFE